MAEQSTTSETKSSLSSVPAKALNCRSRQKISNELDVKTSLPAKNDNLRDYRGLAELMGFQYNDIKNFERHTNPTLKILEAWETQPDAVLDKLIHYLEEMERYDVIEEISPLLEADAKKYLEIRKLAETPLQVPEVTSCPMNLHSENDSPFLTRDDIRNGECTFYDAYVSYADEDIDVVNLLTNYLESPDIGLKLFLRTRDMLAGCTELDANAEIINRSRRVMIILSENYLKSPACEFQTKFAASLAVDQRQRILIPVILEPCRIPLILKYLSKVDFTNPDKNNWVYAKLVNSLLPEHRSSFSISSLEMGSNGRIAPPQLRSPVEKVPAITFPPSTKQLLQYVDNSETEIIPINATSEHAKKDSISNTSRSKKWRLQLASHFKKARTSSSAYSSPNSASSSSGATSGFHSQSRNTLETFESYSNDTAL